MAKDILVIASALQQFYTTIFKDDDLTQMKMHKLLYFAQKCHYSTFGEWLFNEDFEGWVHGPVNKKVRSNFNQLSEIDLEELTLKEEYTLREVVHEYGQYSAGVLRNLSHEDQAYKTSREGLDEYDRGFKVIPKGDILNDLQTNETNDQYLTC